MPAPRSRRRGRSRARPTRWRARAGLADKEAKRDAKVLAVCGGVPIADVKDRLGFGLTCGAAGSVGAVSACLAAELESRTERVVGTIAPRGCALLRAAGQLTD